MRFDRINPSSTASQWVECYWIIENDDPLPVIQKIIPDGFPEIIFHFGDPYEINLGEGWSIQSKSLLAGQIRKYFFLKNTGKASMMGIKLKPATLTFLFGINMELITDKVVEVHDETLSKLNSAIRQHNHFEERVATADNYFEALHVDLISRSSIQAVVNEIFKTRGVKPVNELAALANLSERQLERLFRKHVGLSPKFYSRIIRFSSIFHLQKQGDPSWIDLAYEAGYADQSHFIRNFKAFTGDDPTHYGFNEKNIANFFLKKR